MKAFVGGIVIGLAILGIFFVHLNPIWSPAVGTNNSYCYVDLHQWTAGCEHAM
jgi:hypothetical protein